VEQQHNDDGGFDGGKGYVPDLLEDVGSVNIGGLETFRVYGGDGCDKNDGIVAYPFPRIEDTDDDGPDMRLAVHIHRLGPQGLEDTVHDTHFKTKNIENKGTHDDPGNEVGEEDHRLAETFVDLPRQFGDKNSHYDCQGLGSEQIEKVVEKRISGDEKPRPGLEEVTEVVETVPGAAEDAQIKTVILEGQKEARHGKILKHQYQQHRRSSHKKQGFVLAEFMKKTAFVYIQGFVPPLRFYTPLRQSIAKGNFKP
jgi:hypothetical protein